MLIEIHNTTRNLSFESMNKLKTLLNEIKEKDDCSFDIHINAYAAISREEAIKALDIKIQENDVYTTKEEYENMIEELEKDIYNQEQGFEELTNVANDMSEDILKKYNKIN